MYIQLTSAACNATRNDGSPIDGVVSREVATCTFEKCGPGPPNFDIPRTYAIIDGCQLVICESPSACYESRISNAENVVCSGQGACMDATIDPITGGVDCNNETACYASKITNVQNNVTCSGNQACSYARIETTPKGFVSCQASAEQFPACYGAYDVYFNATAGCLNCGVNAFGGLASFTDAKMRTTVTLSTTKNDVEKTRSVRSFAWLSCNKEWNTYRWCSSRRCCDMY